MANLSNPLHQHSGWDTVEIKEIDGTFFALQKEIDVIQIYKGTVDGGVAAVTVPSGDVRLKKIDIEIDS